MEQKRAGRKKILAALVPLLVLTVGARLYAEPLALDAAVMRALAKSPVVAGARKG